MLSVLIEGCCADALDFTSGKCGFEDIRCIDGALGAAGANQCVKLVDEEDNVLGPSDFVDDRLYSLFELAAVFCPGDHHRQV